MQLASPKYFYLWSGRWLPWFGWTTVLLSLIGLYWGLVIAPPIINRVKATGSSSFTYRVPGCRSLSMR